MFLALLAFVAAGPLLIEGNPVDKAWTVLRTGLTSTDADKRTKAVQALSILDHNSEARRRTETALKDTNADVRVEAAHSAGEMHDEAARPELVLLLKDKELKVVFAAADALYRLKDPIAYQVYYALLTGERKSSEGLLQSQLDTLRDRKQLEKLAIQTGIGFIPYGGMGWQAWKAIMQDPSSPVKALAAERLASDPDPKSSKALREGTLDKRWQVRAAVATAIGQRGDKTLLDPVANLLLDDNELVRDQAAAAVIRLSERREYRRPKPYSTGLVRSNE